jgi:hypothetical protein
MFNPRTILLLLLCAIPALAQPRFDVVIERPERTLDTSAFTTFEIRVHSLAGDTLDVRMARVENNVPDTSWHTSICSINTCYPESVSLTEPERLAPGGMTGFTVHVFTGHRYGDTARILLRIDAGEGTEAIMQEISIATAQPERRIYRLEPEALHRSAVAGDTALFTVWVYNEASDTLGVSVARIDDFFPDSTWSSRLGVQDVCYDPDVDAPPPVVVESDHATWFTLRVTGRTPATGTVVLRFNTTRGTEPVEHRFTLDLGLAGLRVDRELPVAPASPVPASDVVSIALGPTSAGREVRLRVVDVAGRAYVERRRADGEGLVRLDVRDLAEGVYRYLIDGEISAVGSFIVVR